MRFVWVFSTPYFTDCTINISSQEQPCFTRKQQTVKQIKSFTHITKKSITILNSCNFFYGLEADTLTVIDRAVILVLWLLDITCRS